MNLILSRHGNTFEPHEPVVWAGSTNDLALAQKGLSQAEKFGRILAQQGVHPAQIYCSPLQRTSKYAEIITKNLNLKFQPKMDRRLTEIDYGDWTGLTQDQVRQRFGTEVLEKWNDHSEWPTLSNWGGSPALALSETKSFIEDLIQNYKRTDTVVVITSGGKLRYFLALNPEEFSKRVKDGSYKVKTGNICKMLCERGSIKISFWNEDPENFKALGQAL